MAKEKHHVFSARTTEQGLKLLSELKAKLGIGWDELVIDAVCAHYGLDRGVMAIPKPVTAERPDKDKKPRKIKAKEDQGQGRHQHKNLRERTIQPKKGGADGNDRRQFNGQKTNGRIQNRKMGPK